MFFLSAEFPKFLHYPIFFAPETPTFCEYAYLVLEHSPDAPEIHRLADLYEDMIKCYVSDAMSKVAL